MLIPFPSSPSLPLLKETGFGGEFFKKVFLSLLIFLPLFSFSQPVNDAGLWTTINIEKKLKNNLSVFLREEFRLKENFSQINLFYTDIGAGYRPANFLKVAVAYRFVEKHLITGFYSTRHRLMLDIILKKKFGDFDWAYRHRLQTEVRNVNSSENGRSPEWYSRSKFIVKYDLQKKYTPYASCELRYQIDDPRSIESDQTWQSARYALGFDYELDKKNTLGFYCLIQREWNVSLPENQYIIGLEYSLTM